MLLQEYIIFKFFGISTFDQKHMCNNIYRKRENMSVTTIARTYIGKTEPYFDVKTLTQTKFLCNIFGDYNALTHNIEFWRSFLKTFEAFWFILEFLKALCLNIDFGLNFIKFSTFNSVNVTIIFIILYHFSIIPYYKINLTWTTARSCS